MITALFLIVFAVGVFIEQSVMKYITTNYPKEMDAVHQMPKKIQAVAYKDLKLQKNNTDTELAKKMIVEKWCKIIGIGGAGISLFARFAI